MILPNRNCEGKSRRDFIQTGLGALGGLGLTRMLQLQAGGATPTNKVRCIMIWLDGGPTHYETFDPKPGAPTEIRGEFKSIPTAVPGVHFCEKVPMLAKAFDKFTVVRSIAHRENNHGAGNHYLMTGRPTPTPVGCGAFVTFHPSFGSVVSHHRGVVNGMPAYISTPSVSRSGGPNFLGAANAPFVIPDDPNRDDFRVRDVSLPIEIAEGRAKSRAQLRASLDRLKRIADKSAEDPAVAFDKHYAQSFDLITSAEAQAAFDISKEPEKIRERYGRNDLGQRLLLARRLTEVGVPFVTVYNGGWDDHRGLFESFRKSDSKIERIDRGVSALIEDLHERGSLENTLVLMLGEFGRTPKVNKDAGRDHWSFAMSVLMAGAGIPGGQIVGATDVKGYYANENVYAPEDFASSLYTKMGVDPEAILLDNVGRPVQLVNNGRLIKELFV
ncbi:MAG: DUF1501 domain-containing protein [Verrucomicrobiae bacterium]|nr:DUF1501 domain-containing protein [Verrucomicrobiae bacterium]